MRIARRWFTLLPLLLSAIAYWTAIPAGHSTSLFLVVLGSRNAPGRLFSGQRDVPGGSVASLTATAKDLGGEAGRQIAGQFYCLALSEHRVTIDYNRAEERRHPFQAKVTDLAVSTSAGGTTWIADGRSTPGPARSASSRSWYRRWRPWPRSPRGRTRSSSARVWGPKTTT